MATSDSRLDDDDDDECPTWLRPYNRRLRNLKGLFFRNVTIELVDRAQDDTSLVGSVERIRLADQEVSKCRSAIDLKTAGTRPTPPTAAAAAATAASTAADAGDKSTSRLVDSFFSLHLPSRAEPVYVSELVERSANPSFSFIHLLGENAGVAGRTNTLSVRLWARPGPASRFRFVLDAQVWLPALHFVGQIDDVVAAERGVMPPNTVFFQMADGIYSTCKSAALQPHRRHQHRHLQKWQIHRQKQQQTQNQLTGLAVGEMSQTAVYDQLFQINVLVHCLDDLAVAQADMASQIASEMKRPNQSEVEQVRHLVDQIDRDCAAEQAEIEAVIRRRDRIQTVLSTRRRALDQARTALKFHQTELDGPVTCQTIPAIAGLVESTEQKIQQHRRRITLELMNIFPIEPVGDSPFDFAIRGLDLPDVSDLFDPIMLSGLSRARVDRLAAALGFVGQAVSALSVYLDVPVPYAIAIGPDDGFEPVMVDRISLLPPDHNTVGLTSTSRIAAPFISSLLSASTSPVTVDMPTLLPFGSSSKALPFLQSFSPSPPLSHPLHPGSHPRFRAEYAVFLLNKDIQIIASHLGIQLVDIKQTLPNLKTVMCVASAGVGPVPERVKGSIPALRLPASDG